MRTIRLAYGLTQTQLGEALDITQEYVAMMERGERRISRRTAIAFVSVINAHKARTKGRRSKTA